MSAAVFSTKLGTLASEHRKQAENGRTVLEELQNAAVALEQAFADMDEQENNNNNEQEQQQQQQEEDSEIGRSKRVKTKGKASEISESQHVVQLAADFAAVCDAAACIAARATRLDQLRTLHAGSNSTRTSTRSSNQDQDQDIDLDSRLPPTDAVRWFDAAVARDSAKITQRSDLQRIDQDAAYRTFRSLLWDVRNTDLPFDPASLALGAGAAAAAATVDDDIVFTTQRRDYKCPLTLQIMTDPYTSTVCKHSFSKAILNSFTANQTSIECPIPGCSKLIRAADLQPDPILKRRVKKWIQERDAAVDTDDVIE